jgi:hypothetical protein
MEITAAASVQLLATSLDAARSVLEANQASPVPASAPPARHADAILQLSAAAQSLLSA